MQKFLASCGLCSHVNGIRSSSNGTTIAPSISADPSPLRHSDCIEGRNFLLDVRYADGDALRLPALDRRSNRAENLVRSIHQALLAQPITDQPGDIVGIPIHHHHVRVALDAHCRESEDIGLDAGGHKRVPIAGGNND
jgi:hypothetical protein